jgi:transcriptional regulator with XRE-family HTH domain
MAKSIDYANDGTRAIAQRIKTALARKGWTQERLELEARFGQGYLTRLLKATQKRVHTRTLQRIEEAMGLPAGSLIAGLDMSAQLPSAEPATLSLEHIPGYAEAEFQVVRLEPEVPFEVFLEARKARFRSPPELITVEYLQKTVKYLNETLFADASIRQSGLRRQDRDREPSGNRVQSAKKKRGA